MKNKIKQNIAILILVISFLFIMLIYMTPAKIYAAADKSLKEEACEAVGCPNGDRKCMDIEANVQISVEIISGGAKVIIYCYEATPNME